MAEPRVSLACKVGEGTLILPRTSRSLILSCGVRSLPPSCSSRRYSCFALVPCDMLNLRCAQRGAKVDSEKAKQQRTWDEEMQNERIIREERVCRNAYARAAQTKTFKRSG